MLGLVLTAGGARGAYQAGVLKRIGELPSLRGKPVPFRIITGASAGAINGAAIAAMSGNFYDATQMLARLWSELTVRSVFKADALSLGLNGLRLLQDLTLGGIIGGAGAQSLLNPRRCVPSWRSTSHWKASAKGLLAVTSMRWRYRRRATIRESPSPSFRGSPATHCGRRAAV
jgi:predicted acylesterase/phospholipase RssA